MANASLWLYRLLVRLVLPVALLVLQIKDHATGKRRPPLAERMARTLPPIDPGGVWIQAVSVGEVEVARHVLTELGRRGADLPVLLTATTATGLDLARRTMADRALVQPCPFDLVAPVKRALDAAQPRLLVLVETELWPEMLHQAHRHGVPVMVANGRLSDASLRRYRRIGRLLEPLLEPLNRVLVRDTSDRERFAALGVAAERIVVVGNIKYDLEPDLTPLDWHSNARSMAGDRPIVVAGSTMDGEEEILLDSLAELADGGIRAFAILAPRHPERFDGVGQMLLERGVRHVRRSLLADNPEPVDVLLLDTIGELARAYQLATVAFVGGSLVATGGHNPLEPAVWGVPVLSGPHVFNFQEVYDEMVAAGGARIVDDGDRPVQALAHWLSAPEAARMAGQAGKAVVERNRGATSRTVDAMLELIDRGGG
jgi:3-deoxy-D-manno-octulosonic-acid transferase